MEVIGSTEPRIFTEPLRKLTPETTLGFLFISFCMEVCHVELLPWQRWLAIHGLEIIGDLDGYWYFRFKTIIVIVARQNGKSKFLALLNLFFIYVLGCKLTIGTAQNLDTANEVWEEAVEIAFGEPELAEGIVYAKRGNSGRQLKIEGGERYKVVSASRSGGRGNSADLVGMDELREQLDWKAWGAVTKTTMARPNAQIWGFSNAGDVTSIVLRTLRLKGHAALGDPDGIVAAMGDLIPGSTDIDETFGIFEWSGHPGCKTDDAEALAQANPSLGYGFLTMRSLLSARSTDPEPVFRTECLSQWVETVIESSFPAGAWESGIDNGSEIPDGNELTFGVDVSADREFASLAVCGKRKDGKWHVEVIARKKGFAWLTDFLMIQGQTVGKERPVRVAYQGRGAPVSSHADDLQSISGIELVPCEGGDIGAWTGRFYDAVCAKVDESDAVPVLHRAQPSLDHAAKIAQTKPLGDSSWAWNRTQSVDDISTLVAVTMAFGAATKNIKESSRVYASAYESRGLLVI